METNFQLLMLSSNLLKSKIPMLRMGGGEELMETNFQLLMLSSNLLKSKIPMSSGKMGGWGRVMETKFPTFDPEFKFAKIQNSHVEGGWGEGLMETNFQLLMLSSNLLKSKIPMLRVGGGRGLWNPISNFRC